MAQEQNFKQYLGWGLVGTPAGRQFTSDGIDEQLKLGKTAFELAQDLGGCLPSPKSDDNEPLYALVSRIEQNATILGFAEYFSIYEQGQSRAGTYFGSFIETANASFSPNSIKDIFSGLRQLSIYQMTHFIDNEKKAYHTSITGKTFEAPKALDKIQLVAAVKNSITKTVSSDFLFIHCQKDEALKVAEYLIKSGLYYQYKDIFFTENEHISAQVRQMKRLQISSSQLFSLDIFVSPYKSEIHYLYSYIQELSKKYQDAINEIKRLNEEQEQIINKKVQEQETIFQQQVNKIEEEKNKLLYEADQMRELAGFGRIELSKFANGIISEVSPAIDQSLDKKLTEFSLKISSAIKSATDNVMLPPQKVSKPGWIILSGILGFIVIVLSILLIYMGIQSSDLETKITEKTNTITKQQNYISELKGNNSKLEGTLNELRSQTNSSDRLPLEVDKNKRGK
ncbi:hypothetical protein CGSHi3655_01547 [Haemophilus influenzae 3655]|uniref:Uncharacterized protein n=1 Tax=Haemophilus influenzae (strain NTHi 3655) TaxID=375177 RepID=A0A0H3PKI3_HAEI3|nr:hypothetical protein [Haemophilus influenzae]EDJ92302.1 hypothetical protein CGSHi3655_01547 [Haemophilus influenzae 3655]KOR00773.1 hypothetical protein ABW52_07360 [Haemophilus influenzae]MCC3182950.1 hypothetical protein [Haemophilus influenzae]MCK8842952.1 hypothetical protein [Haemophilus influenzae]MCK8919744.1 hypothetical protein [Haemophilus influenzae]